MQILQPLILLCCILSFTSGNEGNIDSDFFEICNETSPISLEVMSEVLINKQLIPHNVKNTNVACFLHCMFTHYGWMDQDGGFELHKIRPDLEESGSINGQMLEYILFTCTSMDYVDKCHRALVFTSCFWTKAIEGEKPADDFYYSLNGMK